MGEGRVDSPVIVGREGEGRVVVDERGVAGGVSVCGRFWVEGGDGPW